MSGGPQQFFNGGSSFRVNDEEEREQGSVLLRTGVFRQGNGGKINDF